MKFKCAAPLACLVALFAATHARAEENGLVNFPSGTTGSFLAELPPFAGVYLLNQETYVHASALYNGNGTESSIPYNMTSLVNTSRVLFSMGQVLPWHGTLYSQFIIPMVYLHTKIFGQTRDNSGLGNIGFSPVLASWRFNNFTATVGLDVITATGNYSPTDPTIATGYMSWCPVAAFRYDQPDGLDIGVLNRLLINQKNTTTDYTSGDAYQNDFYVGWNLHQWKLGVTGGLVEQYQGDIDGTGASPNAGNRLFSFNVGPSLTRTFELFGKRVSFNLNYQAGVIAQNTAKASTLWFNFTLPLDGPFFPGH